MIASTSPRATERSKPSSTTRSPNDFETPSSETAGSAAIAELLGHDEVEHAELGLEQPAIRLGRRVGVLAVLHREIRLARGEPVRLHDAPRRPRRADLGVDLVALRPVRLPVGLQRRARALEEGVAVRVLDPERHEEEHARHGARTYPPAGTPPRRGRARGQPLPAP